eukprot:Gb_22848 [translate_table: standard]
MKKNDDPDVLESRLLAMNGGDVDAAGQIGTQKNKISIDEMLQKWVGEFGWWQLKHFVLTSLGWTVEALHTMVMIFADRQPHWHCKASIDDPSTVLSSSLHLHSLNVTEMNVGAFGLRAESCSPTSSVCEMEQNSWEWVGGQAVSTVSEWGLICGDKYKVGVVQSVFFIGCLLGAGLFGHLSDSFLGRKGVLRLVCGLNAVFGFLTAFSPNYWVYVILRLLTGVSSGGVGLSAFVLATEPVGPSKRGPVGMSTFYFFSAGIAILPALSYWCSSWRWLYVITSIPSLLYSLLILPFISESPRWYLVKGKIEDAMNVMRSIADKNGNSLPEGVCLGLEEDGSLTEETEEASGSLRDVLRSPVTRTRLIIMVFIWLACAIVYYGLSLNVVNLSTNLYISVFLNGVAEMPAFAITAVLLGKFGRRAMLVATMVLSGVCCVMGSIISLYLSPGDHHPSNSNMERPLSVLWKGSDEMKMGGFLSNFQLVCGLMGIFGMAGTYNLLFIYTAELFPTVVRNAALGLASQAGQIGAIIAPLVVVMGSVSDSLPFAMIGVWGFVGGFLAVWLPETLNKPMYETMSGMEYAEISSAANTGC